MNGRCLCGSVRYRFQAAPKVAVNCHCSQCRRHSGASFLTYVAVAREAFCLEAGDLVAYRSSEAALRSHCATCGSPVTFVFTSDPDTVWVTAGTLDDPDACPPSENWFTQDRLAWTNLDANLICWSGAPQED